MMIIGYEFRKLIKENLTFTFSNSHDEKLV